MSALKDRWKGTMLSVRALGSLCECGRLPTSREVYWSDLELWDNYCEACYIWHCWWVKKPYIPYNDTIGFTVETEAESEDLEAYVINLYHKGGITFPKVSVKRSSHRPHQIINIIKTNPGIMAHELSMHLGYRGQSSLYRHTTPLVKKGVLRLVKSEKDARKSRYFIVS